MIDLSNYFLVSMPKASDDVFVNSVVCVTEHNTRSGAIGVMINKPIDRTLNETFFGVDFSKFGSQYVQKHLYFGGPISTSMGFVLHDGWNEDGKLFSLTNEPNIFDKISSDEGRQNWLVSVGYSSWSEGQLEDEIKRNEWLVVKASSELLFDVEPANRYHEALRMLGINNISQLYSGATVVA